MITSTAAAQTTNTRVPLQSITSSALNARVFTTSLSTNLKYIIDRTPQLKRSLTLEIGSLPSTKRACSDVSRAESILPSPASTPTLDSDASFADKSHVQASLLKARLQMAYYKIKNKKTQVSSSELLDSLKKNDSKNFTFSRSLTTYSRTPNPKSKGADLLAASTPIPVSAFKSGSTKRGAAVKSVSFQSRSKDELRSLKQAFLPQIPQVHYTTSSPSKFVTSLPAPSNNYKLSDSKTLHSSSVSSKKRTLKAPTLPAKTTAVKLPSLYEVTSSLDTSTPLPKKPPTVKSLSTNNLPTKDNVFTPVKPNKRKSHASSSVHDETTQLMSSPSKLMTTPSSMGAAKSLLQLALNNE